LNGGRPNLYVDRWLYICTTLIHALQSDLRFMRSIYIYIATERTRQAI
jgi:hypothetical protein